MAFNLAHALQLSAETQSHIAIGALSLLGMNLFFWTMSVFVGKCWPVDFIWSSYPILVVGFILYHEAQTKAGEELRTHMVLLCATCFWGFRLTFNFINRGGIGHEDWRYAAMREKIGYSFWFFSLFLVFLGQSIFMFLGTLPFYRLIGGKSNNNSFDAFNLCGLFVMLSAVVIETTSDEQLDNFVLERKAQEKKKEEEAKKEKGKKKPKKEEEEKQTNTLTTGLWAYSRHPNYFGELSFWWGVWIYAGAAADYSLIGAMTMTFLFFFISIPLMEKRHAERRKEEYEEYKKKVPSSLVIVPPFASPLFSFLVVAAWFLTSAVLSTYFNSKFLLEFANISPLFSSLSLTLMRFLISSVIGLFASEGKWIMDASSLVLFVPSFFLALANFSNSLALNLTGITVTYVVKASMPLVTVMICLFQGKPVSPAILLTMLPLVIGVGISSYSDYSFLLSGFVFAWVSTFSQAFMNVKTKEALAIADFTTQRAFFFLCFFAAVQTFFLSFFVTNANEWGTFFSRIRNGKEAFVVLFTGVAYYCEYLLNFLVTKQVSEVAFSVLDVCRRLAIIVVGAYLFDKQLTEINAFGISLACVGALAYSQVNRMEKKEKQD